jgi:hypothetical protein
MPEIPPIMKKNKFFSFETRTPDTPSHPENISWVIPKCKIYAEALPAEKYISTM